MVRERGIGHTWVQISGDPDKEASGLSFRAVKRS